MSKDRTRRTGLSSWCKSCRTVSTRGWTNKNTQRLKSYRALKYEQNYDYMKARDYSLKQRYGIDLNGYDLLLNPLGDRALTHESLKELEQIAAARVHPSRRG